MPSSALDRNLASGARGQGFSRIFDTDPPQTQVLHLSAQSRAMWLYNQRAIGRFLGNGIRSVMGSSSLKADARLLGARLKISSAAFW